MKRIFSALFLVLVVTTVAAAPSVVFVSCTGTTNAAPRMQVFPASIAFGSIDTAGVAVAELKVKNVGGGTLLGVVRRRTGVPCAPNFSILKDGASVDSIPFSLGPGLERSCSIRYTGIGSGPYSCDIEVRQR